MRKRSIEWSKNAIKVQRKTNSNQSISKIEISRLSHTKKKVKINLITQSGHKYPLFYPFNASLWAIKQSLLTKIENGKATVYFNSVDPNTIFDYMFEEGIGVLSTDITITYTHCQTNIIESGNINAYEVQECISIGGFSKVYMVRSKKTGKFYAGKFISKNLSNDKRLIELVFNEKSINEILDYQFIVKMHNFIETKNFYVFILDYCPSGELFTLMKQHRAMTEEDAKFYFIETALALRYLHQKGIIYRDLKPENILLDKNGHVKLADFGLAKIMKGKSHSYCGSLQYMAPQIIQGKPHSFAVDYYCLGSLLFELLVGCPPFYSSNYSQSETKMHILHSPVQFPPSQKFSQQYKDLVSKLLDKDQKKRLGSTEGFKQILGHPWIGKLKIEQYEEYRINPPFTMSLNKCNFEKEQLPHNQIREFSSKIKQDIQNFEKFRSMTVKYRVKSIDAKQKSLSKTRADKAVKSNEKDKDGERISLKNDTSLLKYQIKPNKRGSSLNDDKVHRPTNRQSLITHEKSKKRLVHKKRAVGKQNQIKEKYCEKVCHLRKSSPFITEDRQKLLDDYNLRKYC